MTQFVLGFVLGASSATIIAMVQARRWIGRIMAEVADMREAGMKGGRALHALVMRISPHGHIDISEEEWEGQELLELKLMPHDGGMRILAK